MKTSNKFLIAAVLVIIISVAIHDFALKAAYLKTNYKSRFYNKEQLHLTDFDVVDLKPSGFTNVIIEQGPKFAVWVSKEAKRDLFFNKDSHTLKIAYKEKTDAYYQKDIIIICPNLESVIARESTKDRDFSIIGYIEVRGFKQDSLNVESAKGTTISLTNNIIDMLNAGTNASGGVISLPWNRIKQSNVNIRGIGTLQLYDKNGLGKTAYNLSPSATVTLNGDALSLFSHQ